MLPSDTPSKRRLSVSFKVANKILLDNISDDEYDSDNDSNKNINDKIPVSVEQQKNNQKLTDEQLSELYKREIKLCTDKVNIIIIISIIIIFI